MEPWKEICRVDARRDFIKRAREGESVTDLCREFQISRKTGYKFLKRYEHLGEDGLYDQSRAPKTIPHRTPPEVRELVIRVRKARSTWGPKKLKAWVERKHGVVLPSANAIGLWLQQVGLTSPRRRRRRPPVLKPSQLTIPKAPNDVWASDFKGEFRLGNGRYCYPLTITDVRTRFLIACTALESTKAGPTRGAFEEAFREYGLPRVIRSDNGCPFASSGIAGLSSLSAFWLRLGIKPERIAPGEPQQNGQHERMHLTLKQETTRPAAANQLAQQERFDRFRSDFNEERPHEALGQQTPASLYVPSERAYPNELLKPKYPLYDLTRTVTTSGVVFLRQRYFFVGSALRGETVGLREVEDGRWLVSFLELELGYYDERTHVFNRSAS